MITVVVELLIFWTPFLLLSLVGFQLQKHYLRLLARVGGKSLVMIPASFCIPIHEISHYIVAKFCGHRILEVRLFSPNNSGTLGFVRHEYKPGMMALFTNMLIGLAPLAGGSLAIWVITHFLMPNQLQLFHNADMLTSSNVFDVISQYVNIAIHIAIERWEQWEFWFWCFLVAHITVFCVPSAADFNGAAWGIVFTVIGYLLVIFAMGQNNHLHHAFIALATTLTPIYILSIIFIIGFMSVFYFIHMIQSKRVKV